MTLSQNPIVHLLSISQLHRKDIRGFPMAKHGLCYNLTLRYPSLIRNSLHYWTKFNVTLIQSLLYNPIVHLLFYNWVVKIFGVSHRKHGLWHYLNIERNYKGRRGIILWAHCSQYLYFYLKKCRGSNMRKYFQIHNSTYVIYIGILFLPNYPMKLRLPTKQAILPECITIQGLYSFPMVENTFWYYFPKN